VRQAHTKEEDDQACWFCGDLDTTIVIECGVCHMESVLYARMPDVPPPHGPEYCCHCGSELFYPIGAEW